MVLFVVQLRQPLAQPIGAFFFTAALTWVTIRFVTPGQRLVHVSDHIFVSPDSWIWTGLILIHGLSLLWKRKLKPPEGFRRFLVSIYLDLRRGRISTLAQPQLRLLLRLPTSEIRTTIIERLSYNIGRVLPF